MSSNVNLVLDVGSSSPLGSFYAMWVGLTSTLPVMAHRVTRADGGVDVAVTAAGVAIARRYVGEDESVYVGVADGVQVLVSHSSLSRIVQIYAAGEDEAAVLAVIGRIMAHIPGEDLDDGMVPVVFLFATDHGMQMRVRPVVAPTWEEIAENYSARTRPGVDRLMRMEPPSGDCGLILWHGPPGTGKTYAIRALCRSWREWCRAYYVTDPEEFFASPHYLLSAIIDRRDADTWLLLIMEDADEFLSVDAKARQGQAMARLLNLADGFIGQGTKTLVLITTNEPVARLHPAVHRRGRCLADVEFLPLTPEEASAWLGEDVRTAMTIADLYALRRGESPAPAVKSGLGLV